MAKAIFQSVELYFHFYVLSICHKEAYFHSTNSGLNNENVFDFPGFYNNIFILTLVVKSNNDRKKFEVFNEIETTNKLIQKNHKKIMVFIFSNGFVAQRFHNYMILKVLIIFDPKLNLFKSDAYIFMQQSLFK
ncbi:hypothetical protein IC800_18900 (plasmid) [Acinetobacter seifertii]|uniref:hypothetical protein n=1 Tax=Acinetobacter seifertii TaxID=1530123 RepID=UPI00168D4D0B|nr:hypothetical protein [Acinetobacter seifertii]QNW96604.1 hypothetical protein IC800_18900 [Acinetobacter seifertii]